MSSVVAEAGALQPLSQKGESALGLGVGVGPGVGELRLADEPGAVAHVDLERRRTLAAGAAGDPHPVRADLLERHAGEVGGDVGGEVGARVEDLVDQLLADRADAHLAPGAGRLGEDRGAVLAHLGDRVPQRLEPVDVGPATRVQAAGRLAAALDGVGDDGGHPEPLPVVERPAELVDQRPEVERDVGHPAADDDVRAQVERLDDPLAAGVDRGVGEPVADRVELGAGVEVAEARRPARSRSSIRSSMSSPRTTAIRTPGRPSSSASARMARAAARGFAPPALVTTLTPFSTQAGEGAAQQVDDVAGVAPLGVGRALLREDRHGQLGEVVAAEVVDVAALDHLDRGTHAVAPERHARAEPDDLAAHAEPGARAAGPGCRRGSRRSPRASAGGRGWRPSRPPGRPSASPSRRRRGRPRAAG